MRFAFLVFSLFGNLSLYAQSDSVDFGSIKKILENDQLEASLKVKQSKEKQKKEVAHQQEVARYNVPLKEDFWPFLSELWVVKNGPLLKWDLKRPSFGLADSFARFLEKMGYVEVSFKILVVNSPNIYHVALPYGNKGYFFLLSLPFIRSMNLSKLEISLLLLEDLLRADKKIMEKRIWNKNFDPFVGSNFFDKKISGDWIVQMHRKYDDILFAEGFSFKDQHDITIEMDGLLRNDLKLWRVYYQLLEKIDSLVKENLLFKQYSKIFPSPELQLNWLRPKTSR